MEASSGTLSILTGLQETMITSGTESTQQQLQVRLRVDAGSGCDFPRIKMLTKTIAVAMLRHRDRRDAGKRSESMSERRRCGVAVTK